MIVYKVIGANTGDSAWTIEAIIQAAKDQCNVVNMSLGTYKCEDVESELLTIEAFEMSNRICGNSGMCCSCICRK